MTASQIVTSEVKIAAAPDVIFPYLTDAEKVTRWQAMSAEADARAGGGYRLEVIPGTVAVGEYVEVDPPRRLVYTWGWEGNQLVPPGSTTVEITLEPAGEHTIVRVAHAGLPTDQSRAQHAMGWQHYLERLTVAAAGGDPGRDPWLDGAPG